MGDREPLVPLGDDYIELIGVVDREQAAGTVFGRTMMDLTADGDRWYAICLASDDVEAIARRLGLAIEPGARTRPDGAELRWRGAGLEAPERDPWLPFFITWDVPHRSCTPAGPPSSIRAGRPASRGSSWGATRLGCASGSGEPSYPSASWTASRACAPWALRGCLGSRARPALAERLREVGDQVVGMLDADRQPDQVAGTSSGEPATLACVIGPGTSISDSTPPSDSARKNSFVLVDQRERLVGRPDLERDHAAEVRHLPRRDRRGRDAPASPG